MQALMLAYVFDQPRILAGLAFIPWNQMVDEAKLAKARQRVVDGVVHRIERIDESGVPVE